jgi:hypothetical protein
MMCTLKVNRWRNVGWQGALPIAAYELQGEMIRFQPILPGGFVASWCTNFLCPGDSFKVIDADGAVLFEKAA